MHLSQITSRIEMIFDLDMSWRALFEKSSVAQVAAMVTPAGSPATITTAAQAFFDPKALR